MEYLLGLRNSILSIVYRIFLKPIFFLINPEKVHEIMLAFGAWLGGCALGRSCTRLAFYYSNPVLGQTIKGVYFPNPVGLAAGKMGVWTIITAACYGFLALFSAWYFKQRSATSLQFAVHAIYATLIYDAITGLTIGPLFFGQSLQSALIGQIPFTAYHLIGNVTLSAILSPILYRWVITNPHFEVANLKQLLFHSSKVI